MGAPGIRDRGARQKARPRVGSRVQPLYHQIYVQMRQMLTERPQDPDCPLPAEPALAERYGVSRVTIRKTLEQLQREGLIVRKHGKGTFPAGRGHQPEKANISNVLENLLSFDARTRADLLEWQMVDADDRLLAQLHSPRLLRIVRLRWMDGVPLSFTVLHLPEKFAPLVEGERERSEPLVQVLERGGVVSERVEQVLSALPADERRATALGVEPGSPLMVMRRLMLDGSGAPVLHQESCYTPDRFEYRMTLSRLNIGPVAKWSPVS